MEARFGLGSFEAGNFEGRLGYTAGHKACLVARGIHGLAIVPPEHNWWAPSGGLEDIVLIRIQTVCQAQKARPRGSHYIDTDLRRCSEGRTASFALGRAGSRVSLIGLGLFSGLAHFAADKFWRELVSLAGFALAQHF